ncbi:MAG: diacylglycerol kinase family protein [Dehalococcoidia bacterium]
MAKQALLIYNPAARNAPPIERLRSAAGGVAGWNVAFETTATAGHATELARSAAERGLDAVVACGGDGTVNEAVNGLAGSTTALAVIRGGTANVWAKEARLPRKPEAALRLLAEGERRTIDLARAGERYFLLMAGVGFDAAIVREVSGGMKKRLGAAAYLLHGLTRARSYRPANAELQAGDESLSGELFWLLLANTRSYAGVVNIAHEAQVDDGLLDVWLLRRGGLLRLLSFFPSILLRKHQRRKHVVCRLTASLAIDTPGLPVHVDGESIGETPMRFEVAPAALQVLVPEGLRSPLFRDPESGRD